MEKVIGGINKFGKILFALTIVTFTGGIAVEAVETSTIDIELTPGQLSLDTAPDLSFGGAIGEGVYSLTNASSPSVQVSDFRGNGAGWNLLVSMSDLTYTYTDPETEIETKRELTGARLIFTGTENDTGLPVASDAEIHQNGASGEVMVAGINSGMGTGTYEFGDVTLNIPNNNSIFIGQYTGILTWTLSNAPS